MRKISISTCRILLLIVSISIYGCQKDNKINESNRLGQIADIASIETAKLWYDKSYPVTVRTLSTESISSDSKLNFNAILTPDWPKAVKYVNSDQVILEIPVINPDKFLSNIRSAFSSTSKNSLSKTEFIIVKANRKYNAFIMTIIADSVYNKSFAKEFKTNTYLNKDSNFSGSILLFTPEGDFISGDIYQKGLVYKMKVYSKAPIELGDKTHINLVRDPGSGGGPPVEVPPGGGDTECTSWYLDTYVNGILVDSQYVGTTCTPVNTNPSPGGGTLPPPGTTADHKLPNTNHLPPNHTNNIQSPDAATCVFKTLEYINQYFNISTNELDILRDYVNANNLSTADMIRIFSRDGLTPAQVPGAIGLHFNYSSTTDITGAIGRGHPLMATLMLNATDGHEVMITGYNNNGTIEYFDPQSGNYGTKTPSYFHYIYEITSRKQ